MRRADELNPVPYRLGGGNCPAGTFFAGSTGLPWFFYDELCPAS